MKKALSTRLIYRSISHIPPYDKLAYDSILNTSIYDNQRSDITGALVLLDGRFVQVLEGAKEKVDALMRRIRRDVRHNNLVVLGEWPITARLFVGWSMAKLDPNPLSPGASKFVTEAGCGIQVVEILAALRDNTFSPLQHF